MLSACSQDSTCDGPDRPQGNQGPVLSIIVSTQGTETRGETDAGDTWGDEYTSDGGSKAENTIDPSEIYVTVHDCTTGKVVDTENSSPGGRLAIYPLTADSSAFRVLYDASHLDFEDSHDYLASVAVNMPSAPRNGIMDSSYAFDISGLNPEHGYQGARIPMFGFVRWNHAELHSSETWNGQPSLGTIHLLRAVCKIEVTLADTGRAAMLSFTDNDLPSLYHGGSLLNRKATVAPKRIVWLDPATPVYHLSDLSRGRAFNEIPSRPFSGEENTVLPGMSPDRRTAFIYLPEASAESIDRDLLQPLRLNVPVQYTDHDSVHYLTGTLFPSLPHTGGENSKPAPGADFEAWRLMRNHSYKFTITDFSDESGLTFSVASTTQAVINVPDYE